MDKEHMQNLHALISEYMERTDSATITIGMMRSDWQTILSALEIAGEM